MTLGRARMTVGASGVVTAATIALALWTFGGPEASRREQRDATRAGHMSRLANALVCHVDGNTPPPSTIADILAACLTPGEAASLIDPSTGAPYVFSFPRPGLVEVCARFEGEPPAYGGFDPASGCLTEGIRTQR